MPSKIVQALASIEDISSSLCQKQSIGLITAAVLATSYLFYRLWFKSLNDGCPTVPYRNPFTGSSAEYQRDPGAFVRKWTTKLGPVYRVHLYGRMQTVVSGRYVREVFMNENFNFFAAINKRFDIHLIAGIPSGSTPPEEGRVYVSQHLTPQLKLLTPRTVENLSIGLREVAGDAKEPKLIYHMYPFIQRMVARASASVFVGLDLCKDDELVTAFQNLTTDIGSTLRVASWLERFTTLMRLRMWIIGKTSPTATSYRKKMHAVMDPEIDRRLKSAKEDPNWEKPIDMLQTLIENVQPPPGLTLHAHLVNFIMGMIFASVHTTTQAGTVVFYRILQHPELVPEILEEQKEVLERHGIDPNGEDKDIFTFEVVRDMQKLDSIIRESLRLGNVYLENRHCNTSSENIILSNGTIIPPGSDVFINSWYNQKYEGWGAYKDNVGSRAEFHPYRFVNTGRPSTKVGDDYLPFGEGKHACPGRWYAIQEIKTIISLVLRDYTLTPTTPVTFPNTTDTALPSGMATIQKKSS